MKRAGNLFEEILDWENLRLAVAKAQRGKRDRPATREFVRRLDDRLRWMRRELRAGTFPLGDFRQFVIHDPKERIITAPCFQERVLHHAIMNVCEPVLESWLIDDTFACRRGRGQTAAVQRAQHFAHGYGFYLKLDIRKYFDSVCHDRLLDLLQRRFKDPALLELLARIVSSFRSSAGHGLPIGSLTSQHFANLYLGLFDRWVKEDRGVRGYVRYMDDMILWVDAKSELRTLAVEATEFLREELTLEVKNPAQLNRTPHGVDFLGCRVFGNRVTLNRRSRVRFRRKLAELETQYSRDELSDQQLQQQGSALVAFTRTAGLASWRFRENVLERSAVSGHKARTG